MAAKDQQLRPVSRLTLREVIMVDMYVEGKHHRQIAKRYRISRRHVGDILLGVAEKLQVPNVMLLCVYWCCPLFRSGLRALDILPK